MSRPRPVRTVRENYEHLDAHIKVLERVRARYLSQIRHDEYKPPVSDEDYVAAMASGAEWKKQYNAIIGGFVMAGGQISMEPPGRLFVMGPVTKPLGEEWDPDES